MRFQGLGFKQGAKQKPLERACAFPFVAISIVLAKSNDRKRKRHGVYESNVDRSGSWDDCNWRNWLVWIGIYDNCVWKMGWVCLYFHRWEKFVSKDLGWTGWRKYELIWRLDAYIYLYSDVSCMGDCDGFNCYMTTMVWNLSMHVCTIPVQSFPW